MADLVELPDVAEPSDSDAVLSDSEADTEFAGEMEIIVQLDAVRNYTLLVDGNNIVEEVLVRILGRDRAGRAPEPRLFFNHVELQKQKTLADCGIEHGSVLHLKCTPRVYTYEPRGYTYESERRNFSRILGWCSWLIPHDGCFPIDQIVRIFSVCSPTKIAKKGYAESSSPLRPNGNGEMEIFVQSKYYGNYALEVDSSNTIMDVLITVLPIRRLESEPEPKLYFNGHLLESAKSLVDYGIKDGSILLLECTDWIYLTGTFEMPNKILGRRKIGMPNRAIAIWEKEHDKILLGLLVEQIQTGGRKIVDLENDSWRDVVANFNAATGLKYENKHLQERFNFYKCEYEIVSNIRHHPEFGWDHQRHVVIATDAKWNEYIMDNSNAKFYRRRAVPFIDLLENVFAEKEE